MVKQDADDFIKFQGKDAFEALLSGSENGIEFRMAQVAGKYDLTNDEARVAYCGEISGLLAALDNPVEREIYTTRARRRTAKIHPRPPIPVLVVPPLHRPATPPRLPQCNLTPCYRGSSFRRHRPHCPPPPLQGPRFTFRPP